LNHSLIDVKADARSFADEVTDLLNRTITHGIRVSAAVEEGADRGKAVQVGLGVGRTNLYPRLIPLTLGKSKPTAYLRVVYLLKSDLEWAHLAVAKSQYGLYLDENGEKMLVHWDYEREPKNVYAAAHVQVNGECEHFDILTEQARNAGRVSPKRPLRDFHFPVGGRRFRPTLEDVVEFLAVEGLAELRPGWKTAVKEHRERWEERQLRAAVRRFPDIAIAQLQEDHHI
jgi:hypothetical protein